MDLAALSPGTRSASRPNGQGARRERVRLARRLSGSPLASFADDRDAPFEPGPHFAHWCPLDGPHHLLHVVPGRTPRLIRHAPEDYWYERRGGGIPFWLGAFQFDERRRAR